MSNAQDVQAFVEKWIGENVNAVTYKQADSKEQIAKLASKLCADAREHGVCEEQINEFVGEPRQIVADALVDSVEAISSSGT